MGRLERAGMARCAPSSTRRRTRTSGCPTRARPGRSWPAKAEGRDDRLTRCSTPGKTARWGVTPRPHGADQPPPHRQRIQAMRPIGRIHKRSGGLLEAAARHCAHQRTARWMPRRRKPTRLRPPRPRRRRCRWRPGHATGRSFNDAQPRNEEASSSATHAGRAFALRRNSAGLSSAACSTSPSASRRARIAGSITGVSASSARRPRRSRPDPPDQIRPGTARSACTLALRLPPSLLRRAARRAPRRRPPPSGQHRMRSPVRRCG